MNALFITIALCICIAVAFVMAVTHYIMKPTTPWTYLPELPDDETTVLFACKDGDVHEGYHEGKHWYYSHNPDGHRIEAQDVYAWCHLPDAPPPTVEINEPVRVEATD